MGKKASVQKPIFYPILLHLSLLNVVCVCWQQMLAALKLSIKTALFGKLCLI